MKSKPPSRLEKISTGIEALDSILHGGLSRNRVYLVEGMPGAGKTTLAMQFLLEGQRRGEKGVYITLSESADELLAMAESHGWSLEGIRLYEMSNVEQQLGEEAQHTIYHPSDVELGEATAPMLQMLEEDKPSRVVFDSLSEMRLLAGDPLRFRRQMLLLKQRFTRMNCTTLLLDDMMEKAEDLQLQSIAHGVIRLERLPASYGGDRQQLRVIKLRGATFRDGAHDYRIKTGGLRIFPRLVSAEHRTAYKIEPVSSGIKELDTLLGGGVLRGTSLLILGAAGVGKSALASQFCSMAGDQGEKSAVFLFDETREQMLDRTDSISLNLHKHMDQGLTYVHQVDPAEVSPGEFAHMIREAVERDGVRQVRIDSLHGYLHAMPDERFLLLQLHELLTYLSQQGVLTLLVATQHGILGENLTSEVNVTYLADTILSLRFFEAAGRIRRAMSVVKKRSGGHEDTIREYQIRSDGFHIGPPLADFQGVFTGNPVYRGSGEQLMRKNGGEHESQ